MGGKHKQAQRIKNNARPSSSGRSAELLASSSQIPQFSSMKEIRFVPPTLSLLKTEEFDSSVSPAFQIVFKKMNKKDCTTKIKALQEFSELVESSEAEAVKTIVGFWATLYSILATDTDHRVREAVHNAHYHIVSKDKKMIAPFLKQLIGPWFTSQYDNYPPAASAASKAFNAAFPQNKVQDCVVFCQKEILTYIYDNLTSKIENVMKNNSEENEAKFERIIISSLQGYCLYLETVTNEHIEKCVDLNKQIITNSRFLKLATHKTSIIRGAWFKVLATLYHKSPFLLSDEHSHIVPVIFNNLDESEPAVVGFVWDAAILIMDFGQDWWKHINLEKNFVSKLKKVLREGGQGNASVIYPNLLSLLHKLPQTLQVNQFYDTFFDSLRFGLKKKSVLNSKSESSAVVTAFTECLQYVVLLNHENTELCQKLIKSHFLPLLEWSLRAEQVCYRTLYQKVAVLIQYWNRNKENFSKYLDFFWHNLKNLLESVSMFEVENEDLANRQIVLLQTLKHVAKPKEQMKVKFSEGEVGNETTPSVKEIDSDYKENLKLTAYALIASYVRQIEEKKLGFLLSNVFSVVQLFESRDFLLGLGKNFGQDGDLLSLYKNLLHSWLQNPELFSEVVVDLTFILLRYVSEDDKSVILTSFLEFSKKDSFSYFVKNAFSHPFNEDPVIKKWLRNPQIAEYLVGIADKNLTLECPPDLRNLFKLAFTESGDELLIEPKTVSLIIEKLKTPLLQPQDFDSIDSCAHLASYVADTIYSETTLLKYGDDLLLSLFEFSCNDHSELEFLTDDTQFEISSSWQDVISTLSKNLLRTEFLDLVKKCAQLVELTFLKVGTSNKIVEVVVNFIKAVFNGKPLMICEVFDLFLNRDFVPTWKTQIEELCLTAEYLSGNCANPIGAHAQNGDFDEDAILKYFVWSLIKISILTSPLENIDEDEDDEEMKTQVKEIFMAIDENKKIVINLLFDLALCQSFLNNYKMTINYMNITKHFEIIKEKVKNVISKLSLKKNEVMEVSESKTFIFCKAIYLFNELMNDLPRESYVEYLKYADDLTKLHLTQVFHRHLDFDCVEMSPVNLYDNVVILRNLSHCDEIEVQIAEVFEQIKKLRSEDIPRFLLDNKSLSWKEMETVIEVVRLFSRLIKDKFDVLSRQHWDFGVICLSSWASNCNKFRANFESEQMQAFFIAVSDFYVNLNKKMRELKDDKAKKSFVEEWEDLFLPNIHGDLFQLWLHVADQFMSKKHLSLGYQTFLQHFGEICDHFHHKFIFNKENNLPGWGKILRKCTNLLINSNTILQIWGYKVLLVLVPGLSEIDLQSDSSTTPNTKGFTIEQFKEILQQTDNIVDGILTGFKLGEDSCQVTPFTDSYTYVFGYLLLWGVMLNLCEKSPPELRYQYADWFKNDNYYRSLLNNLFKLLPTETLHYSEGKAKAFMRLFLNEPNFSFKEPCTSEQLEHVACWTYYLCLSQLPALVRTWWSETETKVTQIVERVTSFYVSPQLCNQELTDVGSRENSFKNMTIKIIPSVREVIAIYTVDEAQMELVITLPQNYPLGGPDVRCTRQIGGPLHKQWLMQLKKYLLHQNGRVWDGLSLWNSSLDKKFDGVEECYICFAVLHPGTYQLPKLTCQTCRKKFHSACLYKWFSTSNKSSCPICRNLF